MEKNEPTVRIENLRFSYRKHLVFENLSMSLEAGRIYGLLGENGVGKTTLLRIISGLLRPKSGDCSVLGIRSSSRNPEMLKDLYFIPEIFIAPPIPVRRFAQSNSLLYPGYDNAMFERLCRTFEVDASSRFDRLSQGQQKKALDIPSKTTLRRVISECATEDRVIVISTHQVRDLENLIDPIVILDREGMILNASVEDISKKLLFTTAPTLSPEAYWSESGLNGYYQVLPNRDEADSRVNLEALFNAALKNKETFKTLFSK